MSDNTGSEEEMLEAITALVPPLLNAMDALSFLTRRLHPPKLAELIDAVGPVDAPVREGLAAFQAQSWPEHLTRFAEQVALAAETTLKAFDGLHGAAENARKGAPNAVFSTYRALRYMSRAFEALYPVAAILPPVSRFFLDEEHRGDEKRSAALSGPPALRDNVGLLHGENEKHQRGGFSLYVPEDFSPEKKYPLIVALHGGSGHGRDFVWSWLFHARARGLMVLAPTARTDTWALTGDDIDTPNIMRFLDFVKARWPIDEEKMLLTGMSDGGTFCYVSGLLEGSPFTHLAPVSAAFHPLLAAAASPERLAGLPIRLTHGSLDWMFPAPMAREAETALARAGASVLLDEIEDLSHTYPREANSRILDWFLC